MSVNGYEIIRLASAKQVSCGQVLEKYVDAEKGSLKRQADGSCIFLSASGCTVYADRPLACRLYPLARKKTSAGKESFSHILPDPLTKGEYGISATVQDFLLSQETALFEDFCDRYFLFFGKLLHYFKLRASDSEKIKDMVLEHLSVHQQLFSNPKRAAVMAELLNVDKILESYCGKNNLTVPTDLQEKSKMHLIALQELLDQKEFLAQLS